MPNSGISRISKTHITASHWFETQGTARPWWQNNKIGRPVQDIAVTFLIENIEQPSDGFCNTQQQQELGILGIGFVVYFHNLCCFVEKITFVTIEDVLSRNLCCRNLRALVWRKIVSVEKNKYVGCADLPLLAVGLFHSYNLLLVF